MVNYFAEIVLRRAPELISLTLLKKAKINAHIENVHSSCTCYTLSPIL